MRYSPIITSLTLAITGLVLITAVSAAATLSTTAGLQSGSDRPVSAASYPTTFASTTTTSNSPTVSSNLTSTMPTSIQQTLSSETVVPPVRKPGNGIGHAYGLIKHSSTTPILMIVDQVKITSVQDTIPGRLDSIDFSAYYSGVQYCTQTATFDPSGLTEYTVSFMCEYKGAGTYNFSVQVYDENQTLIGTSL